ncbi:YcxB family protein [Altererythrobacter sp. MF3-039]|uniref:YcxB family protein n=1 Tax=Altererythrobacter sp. MF3-039 TaxID=3252901 RepID=UPI00390C4215
MDEQVGNRAEFTITEAQVIAGTREAMKRHFTRMPYSGILTATYVLVVALLAFLLDSRSLVPLLAAAVIAPPIAYWLIMKFSVPWQARRHFRQAALLSDRSYVEWDSEGITLGGPKGQARLGWHDFYAWDRIAELVMLYQSEAMFNMIPVEAIGEVGADQIEGYLRASGVKWR